MPAWLSPKSHEGPENLIIWIHLGIHRKTVLGTYWKQRGKDDNVHLLSEVRLSPTAFLEGLWSLYRGPAGFQNAMEGFKNYAGSSTCRLGKRLSASQQRTTSTPTFKFRFIESVPHSMTPKTGNLAARRPLGLWFPKEVILSPKSGLPAL